MGRREPECHLLRKIQAILDWQFCSPVSRRGLYNRKTIWLPEVLRFAIGVGASHEVLLANQQAGA